MLYNEINFLKGVYTDKDFLAPSYINLNNPKFIEMDNIYYSTLIVTNYGREYYDLLLKNIIDTNINVNISIFYERQDNYKTIRDVPMSYSLTKNTLTGINGIFPKYITFTNNIILQLFEAFFRERQKADVPYMPKTMSYSSVEKSISGASVVLPARSKKVPDFIYSSKKPPMVRKKPSPSTPPL